MTPQWPQRTLLGREKRKGWNKKGISRNRWGGLERGPGKQRKCQGSGGGCARGPGGGVSLKVTPMRRQLSNQPWQRRIQGGIHHSPKRGCSKLENPQPPGLASCHSLCRSPAADCKETWEGGVLKGEGAPSASLPTPSLLCPLAHRQLPRAGQ